MRAEVWGPNPDTGNPKKITLKFNPDIFIRVGRRWGRIRNVLVRMTSGVRNEKSKLAWIASTFVRWRGNDKAGWASELTELQAKRCPSAPLSTMLTSSHLWLRSWLQNLTLCPSLFKVKRNNFASFSLKSKKDLFQQLLAKLSGIALTRMGWYKPTTGCIDWITLRSIPPSHYCFSLKNK